MMGGSPPATVLRWNRRGKFSACNLQLDQSVYIRLRGSTCRWTASNKMAHCPLQSQCLLQSQRPLQSHFPLQSQILRPWVSDWIRRGLRICNNKSQIDRPTGILNRPKEAWITMLRKEYWAQLSSMVQPASRLLDNSRMPMWLDLRNDKERDITSTPRAQKRYNTAMVTGL